MEALVAKVSPSGKTMLVGIKKSKYDVGYQFGWVANPDGLKKGDIIKDMPTPTGTVNCTNEAGEEIKHEDGSNVVRFVF
jgi:hypothetical protein